MEIDLLTKYPKRNRDIDTRRHEKSEEIKKAASKYGWEYFEKKGVCYGGYTYDGRWVPVVDDFIKHYNLTEDSKVLDVGCAKGYMVFDFIARGIDAQGADISMYGVQNSPEDIRDRLHIMNAKNLWLFGDNEFDLVISINTIHCLDEPECREAVREIQRVGKKGYIVVDSWRNKKEKQRMLDWNVTGRTVLSSKDWKKLFKKEGYTGDYFWFIP